MNVNKIFAGFSVLFLCLMLIAYGMSVYECFKNGQYMGAVLMVLVFIAIINVILYIILNFKNL